MSAESSGERLPHPGSDSERPGSLHADGGSAAVGVWPQAVLDLLVSAGERTVFEDGGREVSGDEMASMVRRIASGLRSAGVRAGDGVTLRLGVDPEAFATIMAAFAVGARVSGVRSQQVVNRSQQVVNVDAVNVDAVNVDAVNVDAVNVDAVNADAVNVYESMLTDSMLIDADRVQSLVRAPDQPLVAGGRPGDIARVLWTSGSTGVPKGCCQTYASMTAAWAAHPDRWPPAVRALAERLQRYLVFGSLSSQVMLEYGVLTLAAGGTLVAARPPGYPDAIARHRATAGVITVGKLHQLVRDQRDRPADLSSLRALLVSGSPLAPARLGEALDVLGPVVFHGYGQTETGMIAMLTPDEMLASPAALDSVGTPPVEVQERDGEIYVRTPAQASSYLNDPAETAAVFVDGWVRTRDLGSIGEDGRLRLTGRARDVIIVQAELVYAGAVERILATDPAVAEAYVIGRPDDATGEAVHAFVVPAAGRTPDLGDLTRLVEARLGVNAAPRTVTVIDRAPVAASGKPDKQALV